MANFNGNPSPANMPNQNKINLETAKVDDAIVTELNIDSRVLQQLDTLLTREQKLVPELRQLEVVVKKIRKDKNIDVSFVSADNLDLICKRLAKLEENFNELMRKIPDIAALRNEMDIYKNLRFNEGESSSLRKEMKYLTKRIRKAQKRTKYTAKALGVAIEKTHSSDVNSAKKEAASQEATKSVAPVVIVACDQGISTNGEERNKCETERRQRKCDEYFYDYRLHRLNMLAFKKSRASLLLNKRAENRIAQPYIRPILSGSRKQTVVNSGIAALVGVLDEEQ